MTKRYYKKGDIIQLCEGAYSDYVVGNPHEVLEPFDLKEMMDMFVEESAERGIAATSYRFYKWLHDRLPIKKIKYNRIYLGEYSKLVDYFEE